MQSQWKGAWKSSEWFETTWFPLMRAKPDKWNPDQLFLEKYLFFLHFSKYVFGINIFFLSLLRYVWPWSKEISIAHDSYNCKSYPYTKSFPTQRKNEINNFVGSIVSYEETLKEECPIECRPKEHLNWTYC